MDKTPELNTPDLRWRRRRPQGLGSVGGATADDRGGETMAFIRREWARMRDGEMRQGELDQTVAGIASSFPFGLATPGQEAAKLVRMQLEHLGADYFDCRNSRIEAVTLGDLVGVQCQAPWLPIE